MPSLTGMSATDRQLSEFCKRQLVAALGQPAANEIEVGLETSVGQGQESGGGLDDQTFVNPTLTGIVQLGHQLDLVGLFGATPTGQPGGSDQEAAPAITATPLTYFGTPDTGGGELGDLGQPAINDQFATVAAHLNSLINDVAALHTLANALRAALVEIGAIKGG